MKIIIACGGSGGHVFPAESLAGQLRRKRPEVEILFAAAPARPMPYKLGLKTVSFAASACAAVHKALRQVKAFAPDAVVSMGSFSGGPFVIAARLKRIPALIHEQNVLPGRSNRMCWRLADKIALSFAKTKEFLPRRALAKTVVTGNPVRPEISGADREGALKKMKLDTGRLTLLVMGGSQGAGAINNAFLKAARFLEADKFQAIHLTGKGDFERVRREYDKINMKVAVMPFCESMAEAYACCDLAVCRAGATTIAEITALGIASILIPYPHGDEHQKHNARLLADRGAASMIEQTHLTDKSLYAAIRQTALNGRRLDAMRRASLGLKNDGAAEKLAEEVLSLADKGR